MDDAMYEHFRNEWVKKWISFATQLPFPQNHSYISIHTLQDYSEYVRYNGMAENRNMTMELMKPLQNKHVCHNISFNPNVTFDCAINDENRHIDWYFFGRNPNVTLDIIKNNSYIPWDYRCVAGNPNITEQMIYNNPDIFPPNMIWNDTDIGRNPNIPISTLIEHGCCEWNYVSHNPSLTMDDVLQYSNLDWRLDVIFGNPNIGKKIFANEVDAINMDKLNAMCQKRGVNMLNENTLVQFVFCLYATMEQIEQSILLPINWKAISRNEYLTMDFVTKHWNNPWNHHELFKNEMKHDSETYINNKIIHILIATIYETQHNAKCETLFEQVVADEYIVSFIIKF